MGARKSAAVLLCVLVAILGAVPRASQATPPARERTNAPGHSLVRVAESAPLVVVAQVTSVAPLDERAYAAQLEVGQVLVGAAVEGPLRVVWEEPASGGAPRWKEGQWVVVALVEAPTGSSWDKRFPAPGSRWTIAADGNAYLPNPDRRSVNLLARYLALSAEQRKAREGAMALVTIVEKGAPPLDISALDLLEDFRRMPFGLDGTATLMQVAMSVQRPFSMRRAIVAMAAQGRLPQAHIWLETLAKQNIDISPYAWAALAQLDEALAPQPAAMLLDREEASLRAIGARYITGEVAEQRLPEVIRSDPDPQVRTAAVFNAALSKTSWGLAATLPALADNDATVRAAAERTIALLGEPAIAPLVAAVQGNTPSAPGAITALSLMGEPGHAALRDIARNNSQEKLRKLARAALGAAKEERGEKK